MATLTAPGLIFGERTRDTASGSEPVWHYEPAPRAAVPSLVDLVRRVERTPETAVQIRAEELPGNLCRRSSLTLVARRAQSRGKAVTLLGAPPTLAALARSCGWGVAGARFSVSTGLPALPPAGLDQAPAAILAAPVAKEAGKSVPADNQIFRLPRPSATSWRLPAVRLPAMRLPARLPALHVAVPHLPARAQARGGLLAGSAAALAGLLVLVLPGATVTLVPASEQATVDVPIVVDTSLKKADSVTARLPGRAISKEVTDTAQAPATGRRPAPDAHASGEVVLINKTEKALVVPKGTIVSAGAVKFATQADLNIAGTVFSGPQQRISMQRVNVLAANGGLDGNVGRFQITKVEGPLASQLDVQNDAATKGGSEKTVQYVMADDRRKLQEALLKTLNDRLAQQLKGQLPSPTKETLIPWSAQPVVVTDAVFNKNEGDEAQTFTLTMKLRYGATAFSNDAYNLLVKQAAASRAPASKPGYEAAGASDALPPEVQGVDSGSVRLLGHARVTLRQHVDARQVRSLVANRPLAEARASVAALPGVTRADVQAWPPQFGRTPLLPLRVGVHLG